MFRTQLNEKQQKEAIDRIIEKLDKLNDCGLGRVTGYMESLMTMPTATKDPALKQKQAGMVSLF